MPNQLIPRFQGNNNQDFTLSAVSRLYQTIVYPISGAQIFIPTKESNVFNITGINGDLYITLNTNFVYLNDTVKFIFNDDGSPHTITFNNFDGFTETFTLIIGNVTQTVEFIFNGTNFGPSNYNFGTSGGGSSLTIGEPVTGATDTEILYTYGGELVQDSNFTYDPDSQILIGPGLNNNVSGSVYKIGDVSTIHNGYYFMVDDGNKKFVMADALGNNVSLTITGIGEQTYAFPNESGTLALKSDIHSIGSGKKNLVGGTTTITDAGITSSSIITVTLETWATATATQCYRAVPGTGTAVLTALNNTGTTNISDGSTLMYTIVY